MAGREQAQEQNGYGGSLFESTVKDISPSIKPKKVAPASPIRILEEFIIFQVTQTDTTRIMPIMAE